MAMTDKPNFRPEEWKLLLESVMAGRIAVTSAEPSGPWGLLKESFAGRSAFVPKIDAGSKSLIKALVRDFETAEGQRVARDGLKKLTNSRRRDRDPMHRASGGRRRQWKSKC